MPRPRTAVPSVTMAIVLALIVRRLTSPGSLAMALQIRATPGVYAIERSSRVRSGDLDRTSIFPPACIRKVRSSIEITEIPGMALRVPRTSSACSSLRRSTATSSRTDPRPDSTMSMARMLPPAAPIAVARRPRAPGESSTRTRMRTE